MSLCEDIIPPERRGEIWKERKREREEGTQTALLVATPRARIKEGKEREKGEIKRTFEKHRTRKSGKSL